MPGAWRDFIGRHTSLAAPPLVPELRFHLVTREDALWRADARTLETLGIPYPFWAFCWAGGQALARAVLDGRVDVAGARVLDLGAGCGVAGIASAVAKASLVECSEIDPVALDAILLNADANHVTVKPLLQDVVDGPADHWEVILAADVCYDRADATRLRAWLERCAAAGTRVFISDPFRGYLPVQGLTEIARYAVPTDVELEDAREKLTAVWRL